MSSAPLAVIICSVIYMLNVFPDYYKSFKCIADRCRHSCCIGWEIDIDADTYMKYASLGGELGRRLSENISLDGTPHFKLCEDERCPFLNERGLCDLILSEGEDILCDICTDHPRFRNFLPGRTEMGIGLCCEEAARLIIDSENHMELICEGSSEESDDYADAVISLRDELLSMASDASISYAERVSKMLSRCRIDFPEKSPKQWAEIFLSLERMDDEWTAYLEKLLGFKTVSLDYDSRSDRLLSYFLYRHTAGAYDDGNIQGRVLFSILSVYIINLLLAAHGKEHIYDIARLYSAEIEYSDENLSKLFSMY